MKTKGLGQLLSLSHGQNLTCVRQLWHSVNTVFTTARRGVSNRFIRYNLQFLLSLTVVSQCCPSARDSLTHPRGYVLAFCIHPLPEEEATMTVLVVPHSPPCTSLVLLDDVPDAKSALAFCKKPYSPEEASIIVLPARTYTSYCPSVLSLSEGLLHSPPCTSLVLLDDVPDAKSSRSTKATLSPLVAASRATPVPVAPPPITRMSNGREALLLDREASCSFLEGA